MAFINSKPAFKSNKPPVAGGRPRPKFRKPFISRRKVCRFCADHVDYIDFKNVNLLRNYISDRGKVLSARITGLCMFHQRRLMVAIKRSRNIALLPITSAN